MKEPCSTSFSLIVAAFPRIHVGDLNLVGLGGPDPEASPSPGSPPRVLLDGVGTSSLSLKSTVLSLGARTTLQSHGLYINLSPSLEHEIVDVNHCNLRGTYVFVDGLNE